MAQRECAVVPPCKSREAESLADEGSDTLLTWKKLPDQMVAAHSGISGSIDTVGVATQSSALSRDCCGDGLSVKHKMCASIHLCLPTCTVTTAAKRTMSLDGRR